MADLWTLLGLLLAALIVGYWLGRGRPLVVLDNAAWNRVIYRFRPTKHLMAWFWVWAALNPGKALHSFRHRKDPEPEPVDIFAGSSNGKAAVAVDQTHAGDHLPASGSTPYERDK